jgi:anti-sigma factor (TIGR02949 family)
VLTCAEAARGLMAFLSGDLPREEWRRVRKHLRQCSSCAAEADAQLRLRKLARGLRAAPLPPQLVARVHAAMQGPGEGAPGSGRK